MAGRIQINYPLKAIRVLLLQIFQQREQTLRHDEIFNATSHMLPHLTQQQARADSAAN
jgi:hypothetical protein